MIAKSIAALFLAALPPRRKRHQICRQPSRKEEEAWTTEEALRAQNHGHHPVSDVSA